MVSATLGWLVSFSPSFFLSLEERAKAGTTDHRTKYAVNPGRRKEDNKRSISKSGWKNFLALQHLGAIAADGEKPVSGETIGEVCPDDTWLS